MALRIFLGLVVLLVLLTGFQPSVPLAQAAFACETVATWEAGDHSRAAHHSEQAVNAEADGLQFDGIEPHGVALTLELLRARFAIAADMAPALSLPPDPHPPKQTLL